PPAQIRNRQTCLRIVRLLSAYYRAIHLPRRRKRIHERRLPNARIARHHNNPRILPPRLEPRIVQHAELTLTPNQRLGLEPAIETGRGIPRDRGSRCTTTIP